MKLKLISILITSLLLIVLTNCERDDICPGEVEKTPRLLVEIRGIANQDSPRSVGNLKVTGVGKTTPLKDYNVVGTHKLVLPLNTNSDLTKYVLHANYKVDDNKTPNDTNDDKILGNADTITIKYRRENQFISRACGFKTLFKDVSITITKDNSNWLRLIKPENDNQTIEDEPKDKSHFYFFF